MEPFDGKGSDDDAGRGGKLLLLVSDANVDVEVAYDCE
jgi:hypothetical protein